MSEDKRFEGRNLGGLGKIMNFLIPITSKNKMPNLGKLKIEKRLGLSRFINKLIPEDTKAKDLPKVTSEGVEKTMEGTQYHFGKDGIEWRNFNVDNRTIVEFRDPDTGKVEYWCHGANDPYRDVARIQAYRKEHGEPTIPDDFIGKQGEKYFEEKVDKMGYTKSDNSPKITFEPSRVNEITVIGKGKGSQELDGPNIDER
ncbi:hypothetical protein SAMN05444392_11910 [Seinonella peptonophila]|uniref:Uncharacterized protein n=1 Tax=Seinonella peptonophila TaxID=112248 RepID=A0A1M5B701_9BACL|nr:hypothetical protein [Seinonella peptonophila]SHF38321.1 hypothetical protein SAMN05444392_11910 [Seinonella peptonophila]